MSSSALHAQRHADAALQRQLHLRHQQAQSMRFAGQRGQQHARCLLAGRRWMLAA
jgi:hypothetical protein